MYELQPEFVTPCKLRRNWCSSQRAPGCYLPPVQARHNGAARVCYLGVHSAYYTCVRYSVYEGEGGGGRTYPPMGDSIPPQNAVEGAQDGSRRGQTLLQPKLIRPCVDWRAGRQAHSETQADRLCARQSVCSKTQSFNGARGKSASRRWCPACGSGSIDRILLGGS